MALFAILSYIEHLFGHTLIDLKRNGVRITTDFMDSCVLSLSDFSMSQEQTKDRIELIWVGKSRAREQDIFGGHGFGLSLVNYEKVIIHENETMQKRSICGQLWGFVDSVWTILWTIVTTRLSLMLQGCGQCG
ncbi:MAG: hypothetical protein ACOYN1_09815 [Polynucleobacter sp.]